MPVNIIEWVLFGWFAMGSIGGWIVLGALLTDFVRSLRAKPKVEVYEYEEPVRYNDNVTSLTGRMK